jgi:hypothetical protein
VGKPNETLAEEGPVGVATIALHGPGGKREGQGTPGQFSNAAFFHRTFNSSKLKMDLRSNIFSF